ncbi:MAG TPA: hypothetical protein VN176_05115 [Verrucomicrobiae bacterium]|jgi:hypothetical protein|nr:hypothetical protein [Verrucomicrobiae bacterium]
MKPMSRRFVALATALVFLVLLPQSRPQQNKPADPGPPQKITGTGCVEAGVEAGCMVLKDVKTQTLYNLYFSGKKPDIGTAIQFEGTKQEGVTICMQGEPVRVSKWTPATMACSKGSEQKAK